MALIDCPECGKQVSENARRCPRCGEKLRTPVKDTIVIIGGSIISGTLINAIHKLIEKDEE